MQRPIYDHTSSQIPAPQYSLRAANLVDLYWLVHVVEAGSFSAAAQRTGVAKSNLSRRIIQLEKRMDVQLLIRKPRALHLTPIGSRIYCHALDMLDAAKAVEEIARDANGPPRGPVHLSAPRVLSPWFYSCLRTFRDRYPNVEFYLSETDGETELANNHLDISLSLHEVPGDSTDIVSRAIARLEMVIVGSPEKVGNLGNPNRLDELSDMDLLTTRSSTGLRPWLLVDGEKALDRAALCLHDYQSMLDAARAGLGLACVPLHSCIDDLRAGRLQQACPAEHPKAAVLYTLTNPHRSITPAARALVQHLRDELEVQPAAGMSALMSLAAVQE
ncbi:LysR family transcriptional regulator [Pseudomonas sp. MM211]|nr:LysR family transcriptional regulator [Pseudomonas sp. MM211]